MTMEDALFGTTILLRNEPQFAVNEATPWLQPNFAAGRYVARAADALSRKPVRAFSEPYFIKSVLEKSRPAPTQVKTNSANLRIRAILKEDPDRRVLIAPMLAIIAEERFFVVEGQIVANRVYHGNGGDHTKRAQLANDFILKAGIRNRVVDVGSTTTGEVIIETNPLFCAGLYGVDPTTLVSGVTKAAILAEFQFS